MRAGKSTENGPKNRRFRAFLNKKVQKRNERQFKAILDKIDPSKKQDNVLKDNQKTMTEVNKLIDKELR